MTIQTGRKYTITAGNDTEVILVTGWEDVPTGIEGSERWPFRIERWCVVEFADATTLLMHPETIAARMVA